MVDVLVYVAILALSYIVLLGIAWIIYKYLFRATPADRALLALPFACIVYCAAQQAYTIVHHNTAGHIPFIPNLIITVTSDLSGSTLTILYAVLTLMRLSVLAGVFFTDQRCRIARIVVLTFGIGMNGAATLFNLLLILMPETLPRETYSVIPLLIFLTWNVFIALFEMGVTIHLLRLLISATKNVSMTMALPPVPRGTLAARSVTGGDAEARTPEQIKSHGLSTAAGQRRQDMQFVAAKMWVYAAVACFLCGMGCAVPFAIGQEEGLVATAAVIGYCFHITYLVVLTHGLRLIYRSH